MRNPRTFFCSLLTSSALAHTRLECPPPRSGKTGAKTGPCDAPDDPSLPAYPLVPNALNTITWLESIPHPGAAARFALSLEGADEGFDECLLLDHVPRDELGRPNRGQETSFHRSSITLWIPDIYCERCSLQLITVMSDSVHGVPQDTYCVYKGAKDDGLVGDPSLSACPAVYHSCAPVSINGTIPRNDIGICNTQAYEEILEWPFREIGNNQNYSTYYHQGNPGLYNQTDARLVAGGEPMQGCSSFSFCDPETYFDEAVAVPATARYRALAGYCAPVVGMEVEPFVLGNVPDQVLFEVEVEEHFNVSICGGANCTEMFLMEETDDDVDKTEADADVTRSATDEKTDEMISDEGVIDSSGGGNHPSGLLAGLIILTLPLWCF